MESYYETLAALVSCLVMVVVLWLGFLMYAVAVNPNALDNQRVERELEYAKQQYIAWFHEDPTKGKE